MKQNGSKAGRVFLRRMTGLSCYPVTALHGRLNPGIRILTYHRVAETGTYKPLIVSPGRFAGHMAYLSARHRVISLDRAFAELQDGSARMRAGVVITFDDGYFDTGTNVLPVLRRFDLPATMFITTAHCDQSITCDQFAGRSPDGVRLHMNWQAVAEAVETPGITIGSHTVTHPSFSRISDELARVEIERSREILQQRLNREIRFFCYPVGDCREREMVLVRQSGYHAAVTVSPGVNRPAGPSCFSLHRTEINDKDDVFDLKLKLAGALDPAHKLLYWHRRRRYYGD
jgi:peptidoglycan/xylan/chitin deacetylase (PgdA/CDA1 family)